MSSKHGLLQSVSRHDTLILIKLDVKSVAFLFDSVYYVSDFDKTETYLKHHPCGFSEAQNLPSPATITTTRYIRYRTLGTVF